jgi:hypothetical protein
VHTGDLHLSIHLGAHWTAAVATAGGRTWPVTFDGVTRMPSGAWIDPQSGSVVVAAAGLSAAADRPDAYLHGPMAVLRTAAGEDGSGPGAAVSALLAHVANAASQQAGTTVATLTVTTSEPWGPKSRQRLTQAATAAGLPEPTIVTAAAAAAAAAAAPGADDVRGRFVLVCTIGDDYPHLAVLDATDQYTQLAAVAVRDPNAPGISQAVADSIRHRSSGHGAGSPHELDWRTILEIDRARTALIGTSRTPMLLPGQPDPVVLDAADLDKAARPHLDQLTPALAQALAEAGIDQADIATTVLVAYDATASTAQTALADAGLPQPVILTQPDHVAAGAAHLTGTIHEPP